MTERAAISVLQAEQGGSVGQPGDVEVRLPGTAEYGAVGSTWLTPGSYLSREIASRREVQGIVERVEPERHCVTVALETDPDDLLDRIFEVERQMFELFERLPFDLRVTVPSGMEALESILASGTIHYRRT